MQAQAAFGDARVYLEWYVFSARHVEVQLLGDGENVIHLGDRDCSVQRRYQKLIEEAPAPRLGETLRVGMRAAAVALGLQLKYQGLGTVEFLVDADRSAFWFLEVNARIQVEHPVTEAVTRVDLVAEQIAVAEGRRPAVPGRRAAGRPRDRVPDQRRGPGGRFPPSPGTVTSAVFPACPASGSTRVSRRVRRCRRVPQPAGQAGGQRGQPGRGAEPAARRAGPVRDRRGGDHPAGARGAGRRRRVRRRGRRHGVPRTVAGAGNQARSGIKVAEIQLVDVSLRDGNQSLWGATGLRTDHILQIAPVLNRVGFRALDRVVATGLPGRPGPGRFRAPDGLRRAGRRVLAARCTAGRGEPARARAHGGRGRPAAGRGARYFSRLAAAEGLPSGWRQPYDEAFTRHQLAGGVLTTLRRQLGELGLEDRFGAVIEEVTQVRAELGYPIMVTPFPQMVMGQALANVLAGSRYEMVPDQVIRYVLGSFGKPMAPVEPWCSTRSWTGRGPGSWLPGPPRGTTPRRRSRCCGCCASSARGRRCPAWWWTSRGSG